MVLIDLSWTRLTKLTHELLRFGDLLGLVSRQSSNCRFTSSMFGQIAWIARWPIGSYPHDLTTEQKPDAQTFHAGLPKLHQSTSLVIKKTCAFKPIYPGPPLILQHEISCISLVNNGLLQYLA